jgi:hypothetical protein
MIYFDENACAELSRISWVVEGINRGGAAPNAGFSLEYSDIDRERRGVRVEGRVVAEVVGGRGSGCTSAWEMRSVCDASQNLPLWSLWKCKSLPIIATRRAEGVEGWGDS